MTEEPSKPSSGSLNAAAGVGPVPVSSVISDRTGDEHLTANAVLEGAEPLSKALRTLDSLTVAEVEVEDTLVSAVALTDGAPPGHTSAAGRARREEILDGASILFAERGYHGSSLRDISRSVGISHPGMLHHFASKEILLGAVIDRLEAHAQGLLDSVDSLQTGPRALDAALEGPWNPSHHAMALLATLSAEIVNPAHPGRYRIARLRLVHEHVLHVVLQGYEKASMLIQGADPAFLSRSMFSLLLSLTVREHSVRELQQNGAVDPMDDVRAFMAGFITS